MRQEDAVTTTHLASQPELGLAFGVGAGPRVGPCRAQLGLSGAAGTQEMAANRCPEATHREQIRDVGGSTPLAPSVSILCLQTPLPQNRQRNN